MGGMTAGQAGGSIAGYLIGSYFGMGALGASIGGMIGRWLDPPGAPDPPDLGDLGVNNYCRGNTVPISIGEVKVYGGVINIGSNYVKMKNEGSKKSPNYGAFYYAQFAVAVSEGTIQEYLDLQINDNSVTEAMDEGKIELTMAEYLGTEDQPIDSTVNAWLYQEGILSIPFIYTAYISCAGCIGTTNSLPSISTTIKGLLTEAGESDANPIKVAYEWMTNSRWGFGIDPDLIGGSPTTEGSTWKIASDYCDELVDATDKDGNAITEPRFRFSFVYDSKMRGYDILEGILYTCRGLMYVSEGKIQVLIEKSDEVPVIYLSDGTESSYTILAGSTNETINADFSSVPLDFWNGDIAYYVVGGIKQYIVIIDQTDTSVEFTALHPDSELASPDIGTTITIRKENIVENSFAYKCRSTRESFNKITCQFVNRDDEYRWDTVDADDVYDIDLTVELREQTVRLDGIMRKSQAYRMVAFYRDFQAYVKYMCSLNLDILGYLLTIGDIVGVSHTIPGWNAKLFRLISMEEDETGGVKCEFIEYNNSIYGDGSDPYSGTTTVNPIGNQYATPGHVERFDVKEDSISSRVYLCFKRPDSNPYWIGASIYKSYDGATYEFIMKMTDVTPSVKLIGDISEIADVIFYDSSTMYGSFPASGSFWIDDEEIYYSAIDDETDSFTGVTRGYNNTFATNHLESAYCYLKQTGLAYLDLETYDIGQTLYFKAVSITSFGISADTATAPGDSLLIHGYGTAPKPPSSLQINGQGSVLSLSNGVDAVLSWEAVTDGANKGYGFSYGYGEYGGGLLENVFKFYIEIYNGSGDLLRYQFIDNTESSFTYTVAMNEADNGSFNSSLTFKLYQVGNNYVKSYPASLITS